MNGSESNEAPAARPTVEPRPSRGTSIAVGAIAVVAVAFFALRRPKLPAETHDAPLDPLPIASTSGSANSEERLARAVDELKSLPLTEAPAATKLQEALAAVPPSQIGWTMPDGSPPPPLPASAPKTVRFGLILIRYAGAQLAPFLAPAKDTARKRAEGLAAIAQTDFAAAVKDGDPGSTIDIGTVRRGILEPAIEYALFTLPKGGVSGVIDTPRGFWIVRRVR